MKKWIIPVIIIFMLAGYFIYKVAFPIDVFIVEGHSMEPTLKNGDQIVLNKNDKDYQIGDVIVLPDPQGRTKFLISRIIGLPNDTVEIKNGKVYVNSLEFSQSYVKDPTTPSSKTILESNQYYIISDNRLKGRDSRLFGPIYRNQIDGDNKIGGKVWKRENGSLIDLN